MTPLHNNDLCRLRVRFERNRQNEETEAECKEARRKLKSLIKTARKNLAFEEAKKLKALADTPKTQKVLNKIFKSIFLKIY